MFLEVSRNGEPSVGDLMRIRNSAFATDMFVAALGWLDLFTWLARNPSDAKAICQHFALAERPATSMLNLFDGWGLLRKTDGVYSVTNVTRTYLDADSPEHMIPYLSSFKNRPSVLEMLEVLRTDRPAKWNVKAEDTTTQDWETLMVANPDFARTYTAGMDCAGRFFGRELARAIDCSRRRRVLDIAGGSGIYTACFLQRYPHLTGTVLERAPVDRLAADNLVRLGVGDRATARAGDMFVDPFPAGHDVHLFVHVLHDWPPDKARQLVAKSFDALEPGGLVVIYAGHINDQGHGPNPGPTAEYSITVSLLYEGRSYSVGENIAMVTEAGFVEPRWIPTEYHRSAVVARKPR